VTDRRTDTAQRQRPRFAERRVGVKTGNSSPSGALSWRRLLPSFSQYMNQIQIGLKAGSFQQPAPLTNKAQQSWSQGLLLRRIRCLLLQWRPPLLMAHTHGGTAKLSWPGWLVTWQDGLPARPLHYQTRLTVSRPTRYQYAKPKTKDCAPNRHKEKSDH